MNDHAVITGVGFTKTTSPRHQELSKNDLCHEATESALALPSTARGANARRRLQVEKQAAPVPGGAMDRSRPHSS